MDLPGIEAILKDNIENKIVKKNVIVKAYIAAQILQVDRPDNFKIKCWGWHH